MCATLDALWTFDLFALYDDLISVAQRLGKETKLRPPSRISSAPRRSGSPLRKRESTPGERLGRSSQRLKGSGSAGKGARTRGRAVKFDDLDYTAAISEFQQQLTASSGAERLLSPFRSQPLQLSSLALPH